MRLTNSFRIERPAAEVFDAFLDIERVATCIPGSKVLGRPAEDTYDGEVKVKVGPLAVAYAGQLRVLEADRDQRRLTMRAKGREKRGAGNADAHVVAQLSEVDAGTVVDIDTDLDVRGKVAQFGRGVISDVSAQIMQTFATNVESMLTQGGGLAAGAAEPSAATPPPTDELSSARRDAADAATDVPGLDAWGLLVRPLLRRHGASIGTVACSAVAAYLGARVGARNATGGARAVRRHR